MSGRYGPPPGLDVNESKQTIVWVALVVPYAFAFITVQLRLLSRRLSQSGSWFDDWLVVAAMAIDTGILAGTIVALLQGLGKHIWSFPVADIGSHSESILMGLFELDNMYYACYGAVKLSVLSYYWRTFKSVFVRRLVFLLNMAVVLWAGVSITMTVLECDPVSGFWINPLEANCPIPRIPIHVSLSIVNAATNLIILILPIPYFIVPHNNLVQNLVLAFLFSCGLAVCALSVIRTLAVATTNITDVDLLYNLSNAWAWTAVEVQVAIVAANLPTLGPIIARIFPSLREEYFTPSNSTSTESLDPREDNRPRTISKTRHNRISSHAVLNAPPLPPLRRRERNGSVDLGFYEADEKYRSMHASAGSWQDVYGDNSRVRSLQDAIAEFERTQAGPYADWERSVPTDWEKSLMRQSTIRSQDRIRPLDPEKRRYTSSPEGSSTVVSPTATRHDHPQRLEWMRAFNYSPINPADNQSVKRAEKGRDHPLRGNRVTPSIYEKMQANSASQSADDASSKHDSWRQRSLHELPTQRHTFDSYEYPRPPPPPPPRIPRTRALSTPESVVRDSYGAVSYGGESNIIDSYARESCNRASAQSPEMATASQMTVTKVRPPPPQHPSYQTSPQISQGPPTPAQKEPRIPPADAIHVQTEVNVDYERWSQICG